jgi:hypothetical protein
MTKKGSLQSKVEQDHDHIYNNSKQMICTAENEYYLDLTKIVKLSLSNYPPKDMTFDIYIQLLVPIDVTG